MFAILGLGNPGREYLETRHNLGFQVVELLRSKISGSNTGAWQKKGDCVFDQCSIGGKKGLLVLPQSYMNRSGEAAAPLIRYFQIPIEEVVVVHDELDLPCGALVLKRGGSAGGHNGVDDLITHLRTGDFVRLRLGIGRPISRSRGINGEKAAEGVDDAAKWVLSKPRADERLIYRETVERAVLALELLIQEGLERAQQKFNNRGLTK